MRANADSAARTETKSSAHPIGRDDAPALCRRAAGWPNLIRNFQRVALFVMNAFTKRGSDRSRRSSRRWLAHDPDVYWDDILIESSRQIVGRCRV